MDYFLISRPELKFQAKLYPKTIALFLQLFQLGMISTNPENKL